MIKPPIKEIRNVPYPEYEDLNLSNGIPLKVVSGGSQEVIKLEVVVLSGRPFEEKPLAANITNRIIREGSQSYSYSEINETMDYHGAYIQTGYSLDYSSLSLLCLSKHFERLIPFLYEMVACPIFPADRLDRIKENAISRLKVELQKPESVSFRELTSQVFGEASPYGYNSNEQLYREISLKDCENHWYRLFNRSNISLFLSGIIEPKHIDIVDKFFGQLRSGSQADSKYIEEISNCTPIDLKLGSESLSSLKLGRRMMSRNHPDFPAFEYANFLLGGYFGSRLMKKLREDKGYTYNVSSVTENMMFDAFFYIATEVEPRLVEQVTRIIREEILRLGNDLISIEEMQMSRNLIFGILLSSLDGPFKKMDFIKSSYLQGFDKDQFYSFTDQLNSMNPDNIRNVIQKYLDPDQLAIVYTT